MNWLFDSPLTIVLLGFGLIGCAAFGWVQTGRKGFLIIGVCSLLLLVGMLLVERMTITDEEAIRAMLQELARDVQQNNHAALLEHISTDAPDILAQAKNEMPRYDFREARVTRIHRIDVDAEMSPRTADTEFNVIVGGSFRQGGDVYDTTVPRWVRLQLALDPDGKWRIRGYEHAPPQEAYLDPALRD